MIPSRPSGRREAAPTKRGWPISLDEGARAGSRDAGRSRGRRSRGTARVFHLAGLALAALGCALEPPEAPRFDTAVHLPLGTRSVTGADLVSDSEYLEGDSAGVAPLAFVLRGEIAPVEAGRFLDLEMPGGRFEAKLGEVTLSSPPPRRVEFALRSLHPDFDALPAEPIVMPVAPFAIERRSNPVPPIEDLVWARLTRGRALLRVRNGLPVPLGPAPGGGALAVRLRNRADGSVVFEGILDGTLPAGVERSIGGDVGGRWITGELVCEVEGGSPGSGGAAIELRADEHRIDVTASLAGLAADSARASVPEQNIMRADSVALSDDVRLAEGEILAGTIPLAVENGLPLEARARITWTTVWTPERGPLVVDLAVPAAEPGRPGRVVVDLDLGGLRVRSPGRLLRSLPWRLAILTPASEGPIDLGARGGGSVRFGRGVISFEQVTGTVSQRRYSLPPTETALAPPEGLDELQFEQARLELAIESSVGLRSEADLVLAATPGDGGSPVLLPIGLVLDPPAGPGETRLTRVTLDETNSGILALIAARPRRLRIEGVLRVGQGDAVATVRRTDSVRGAYEVRSPLRVRIGRIQHRTEPFRLTLDEEERRRIRENVIEAEATGAVRNHFPAGLTARLFFGVNEESLDLDPQAHPDSVLALGPVSVDPGRIGGSGPRVTEAVESPFTIPLAQEQVSFFARAEIFGRIELSVSEADPDRVVEVTAADYVEVNAMVRFAVRVEP